MLLVARLVLVALALAPARVGRRRMARAEAREARLIQKGERREQH